MPVICGWLNDYSLDCATKTGYFYRYSINDNDNSYKLLSEHTLKDNDYDKQQKTKIYKNIDNKSKDKSKDKSKNKIKNKNKVKNKHKLQNNDEQKQEQEHEQEKIENANNNNNNNNLIIDDHLIYQMQNMM